MSYLFEIQIETTLLYIAIHPYLKLWVGAATLASAAAALAASLVALTKLLGCRICRVCRIRIPYLVAADRMLVVMLLNLGCNFVLDNVAMFSEKNMRKYCCC